MNASTPESLQQSGKLVGSFFHPVLLGILAFAALFAVSGCSDSSIEQNEATEATFADIESVQAFLLPNYVSAERLPNEYKYRIERNFDGKGKIFIGRISPPPGARIARMAIIEDDNSFVTAVYPTRTLTFLAHGYEPLEVTEGKHIWGPVYDVGVVGFKKTPPENLRTVTGSLQVEEKTEGNPPEIKLTLTIPNRIVVSSSGGHWQGRSRPVVEAQILKPGDAFTLAGLSPILYEIDVTSDGYVAQTLKIEPDLLGEIDLGTIQMHRAPKLRFDYVSQIDLSTPEAWEKPKSIEILCDNKSDFLFTPMRDEHRNSMRLRLKVEGTKVTSDFSWSGSEYFLLGDGKLEDYLKSQEWISKLDEMNPSSEITIEGGKVYFFRNKGKKVSSLFAVSEVAD